MNFDAFINTVIGELSKKLGDSYTVRRHTIKRNNGITRQTIMILDGMRQTVPCYFMENYYELYQKPEDIKIIAEDIIKTYQKETVPEFLFDQLQSTEQILNQVLFRVVSMDMNTELLKNVPHHDIPELGLSMLFYLIVNTDDGASITMLLWNSHLKIWRIPKAKLLEYAWKNTPLAMEYNITDINGLLAGHIEKIANSLVPPMYVISSRQKNYGAGCILYPGVLEDAAKKFNSDFYILPSSVHETIAVLADRFDKCQAEAYKKVVIEVNRTVLSYEDILTDSVYYYSRKEHKLFLAI